MKPGKLIVIEGPEGSGKTTLAKALQNYLMTEHQIPVLTFKEPGAAYEGKLRELLLSGHASAVSELFLFLADRAQNIKTNIKPALRMGNWVILDRFSDSTVIYQAIGKETVDVETCKSLCKVAEQGVQVDKVIVLRCGFNVCKDRLLRRNDTARLAEQATEDVQYKIWEAYQDLSHRTNAEINNVSFVYSSESTDQALKEVTNTSLRHYIDEHKTA